MRCYVLELQCFKVWLCTGLPNHKRTLRWCSGRGSQLLPLKHETVTASGHRAHTAVLRKAPGGTCDPPGPAWPPMAVPKGKLEYFLFVDLHKYVPTTHLIPSFAAKSKGTGISNGTRLDLPSHRVSCISRGWEGRCCSLTHTTPGMFRTLVAVPAPDWPQEKAGESVFWGWSLDSFRPVQYVSYSWNEKTWASAWAFIADQKTNEAKNVSLIPWLLQFSAEFVPDLAHFMIKWMWVVAHG